MTDDDMKSSEKQRCERSMEANEETPATKKTWIGRLLDWLADGRKRAVKSGNFCPT